MGHIILYRFVFDFEKFPLAIMDECVRGYAYLRTHIMNVFVMHRLDK